MDHNQTIQVDFLADRPEAVSVVGAWIHQEWGYKNPGETLESKTAEVAQRLVVDSLPLTLLASVGDEPVGTASIIFDDLRGREDLNPWLADVFVLPEHRGRGVASAMCRSAVAAAAAIGVETLYLFTPDAGEMYLKLGWHVYEHTVYRAEQIVVMYCHPTLVER